MKPSPNDDGEEISSDYSVPGNLAKWKDDVRRDCSVWKCWPTLRKDEEEKRIAGLTHSTTRYFFCKNIAASGIGSPDPKTNYRFYRLGCLIARNQPHRYLRMLFKKNIAYHLQLNSNWATKISNIIKSTAADMLMMVGRIFRKNSRHSRLKIRFDRDVKDIRQDQPDYM